MQGPIFGLADAVQDTPSKTEQEEENSAEIALQNMLNAFLAKSDDQNEADLKEFLTILFRENQQKFIRAREKNLQLLPSDYRDVLLETEKLYEDIIGSMNITAVIGAHCENALQYIIRNPGLPSLEGEAKKKLLNLLAACHQSLMNGSFMMLLQGADDAILKPGGPEQMANLTAQAQQMLQGMMMPILYLSRDDLKAMLDMLIVLEEQLCTQETPDLAFCNELKTFRTFLQATYEKNSNRLSELMLDLVNEEFDAMHGKIKGMVMFFDQKSLECDGSGDVELRNACEFFLKIFKRYANALAAFERIKNSADVTVTNDRYTIFKMITYGYYIGHGFYDLWAKDLYAKYDKKVTGFSYPNLADWAFTGALSGWMFFNHRTDLMNTQLFTRLMGAQPVLKPLDHHMLIQLNVMAAVQVLPIFFNPKAYVYRPGRLGKVIEKVGTAWLYYHIFEQGMRNKRVDLLDWPNENRHMHDAIIFAINQGKYYLGQRAELAVGRRIKPKHLEIAYDYSMGVIKPEVAEFVIESLVDLVFLRSFPKNRYILTESLDKARSSILHYRKNIEDEGLKNILDWKGKTQQEIDKEIASNRGSLVLKLRPSMKEKKLYEGSVLKQLDDLKGMDDRNLFNALKAPQYAVLVNNNKYFDVFKDLSENEAFSEFFLDKIARISPNDIFESSFGSSFQNLIDRYYGNADPDEDNVYKLYFQQKLLSYTAKSIGGFWGRKVFHRYGKTIGSVLSTGADAVAEILEAFWLISPNTLDSYYDFKTELSEELELTLNEIKEMLLMCFDIHSPTREAIITQLRLIHVLEDDVIDPTEQNRALIYFVLGHLSSSVPIMGFKTFKMLTSHEALKIIRSFERNTDNIALTIDNIINGIRANIAGMCGEWIGESVANRVATNYFWSKGGGTASNPGPWYARLADAVGLKGLVV
jgi:hypothetical protein